jgi:type VI secretion system secreted protein Hcp
MAVYMEFEGIKGDATQAKHEGWITLNSVQWGAGRGISTPTGSAENRESSEPSISEVVVSKALDSASLLLFQEACIGKEGKKVKIDFCTTANEGEPYLQVELTNTLISGHSFNSGGDKPSETLSLNFTKININETGGNQANSPGQPIKVQYDLAKASK